MRTRIPLRFLRRPESRHALVLNAVDGGFDAMEKMLLVHSVPGIKFQSFVIILPASEGKFRLKSTFVLFGTRVFVDTCPDLSLHNQDP
jgi:hypothetical protein